MDWSKAKTILIIAFLITDLFLIYTYGISAGKEETEMNEKQVVSYLESRNIFIETEIPTEHQDMPVLKVQHLVLDSVGLKQISNLVPLEFKDTDGDEVYEAAAEKIVSDAGIQCKTKVVESVSRAGEKVQVNFENRQNGIAIEPSYITVTFEEDKPPGVEYYWLCPALSDGDSGKKKQKTISAQDALLTFMSRNSFDKPVHVKALELVFWLDESSFDVGSAVSDTALPAWKIELLGGDVEYIEAYEKQ